MAYELCDEAQQFIPIMDDEDIIMSVEKARYLASNLGVKLSIGTENSALKSASETSASLRENEDYFVL